MAQDVSRTIWCDRGEALLRVEGIDVGFEVKTGDRLIVDGDKWTLTHLDGSSFRGGRNRVDAGVPKDSTEAKVDQYAPDEARKMAALMGSPEMVEAAVSLREKVGAPDMEAYAMRRDAMTLATGIAREATMSELLDIANTILSFLTTREVTYTPCDGLGGTCIKGVGHTSDHATIDDFGDPCTMPGAAEARAEAGGNEVTR